MEVRQGLRAAHDTVEQLQERHRLRFAVLQDEELRRRRAGHTHGHLDIVFYRKQQELYVTKNPSK